jgi:hypothetical protein
MVFSRKHRATFLIMLPFYPFRSFLVRLADSLIYVLISVLMYFFLYSCTYFCIYVRISVLMYVFVCLCTLL